MKRSCPICLLAVLALAGCGTSAAAGPTLAQRCHTVAVSDQAAAVKWADSYIASLPGPVSAARRVQLIAGQLAAPALPGALDCKGAR